MNRAELVAVIASDMKCPVETADKFLDVFISTVQSTVTREEVKIANFGRFDVVQHSERNGRHPQTGAPLQIPAKARPRFVASPWFKLRVTKVSSRCNEP